MSELPPYPTWLLCEDCRSHGTVEWDYIDGNRSMCFALAHSPTCPYWQQEGRELVLAFLPQSAVER